MKEKLNFNKRIFFGYIFISILSGFIFSCEKSKEKTDNNHHVYYCPMCEGQEQHTPGKCKICKMELVSQQEHAHIEEYYTCPMHPEIKEKKPGQCPICGMDLVKKTEQIESEQTNIDPVLMSANSSVLSKVKAIKPMDKSISIPVKVNGYITYDERKFKDISSRYEGRIEKLYVKYPFQEIRKGQPLFEIYSHELRNALHSYLLIQNDQNSKELIDAARQKLILLGMNSNQIDNVVKRGHENANMIVYSPYNGFVVEKENGNLIKPENNEETMGVAMNSAKIQEKTQTLMLRQGDFVNKGQAVFRIVSTDQVWGILEIPPDQIESVKIDQKVFIKIENSLDSLEGKVNFIEPFLNNNSRFLKARVYINNQANKIKIGNLLSGTIITDNKKGIWIPKSSMIDLGKEKIVFIKTEGTFKTHVIQTGLHTENLAEVLYGLNINDEIAENAQYLIDSEGFIKTSDLSR